MGSSASKSARRLPRTAPTQARELPKWAGARAPTAAEAGAELPPSPSYPARGGGEQTAASQPQRDLRGNYGTTSRAGTGAGAGAGAVGDKASYGRNESQMRFSGEKDEAIMRDAQDPQFMANLSRLGQVSINDAGAFQRPPALAQRTLSSRRAATSSPTQVPPAGYLTALMLIQLLDAVKSLPPNSPSASSAPADNTNTNTNISSSSRVDPLAALCAEYRISPTTLAALRAHVNSPSVGEDVVRVEEGEEVVEMRAVWVDGPGPGAAPGRR